MESGPPKMIERIAGWLIPPACREEVLGDLRERRGHAFEYSIEAVHTIPCVVYSRIRRTTDPVVLLMEAASLYTAFVIAAWELDRALLADQASYGRLAIPALTVIVTLVFADAYSDPKKRWPLKPLFAPILGIALAFAWQTTLGGWAVPHAILSWGGVAGVLLVSTLRLMFPPIADRPQAANGPAYWQKLELIRPGVKDALLPGAIVLAIILYLSLK